MPRSPLLAAVVAAWGLAGCTPAPAPPAVPPRAAASVSDAAAPARARQALQAHAGALRALFPGLQGTRVDQATGAAVLDVLAPTPARAGVSALRPDAEALLGVPVRIEFLDAPLRQQ